MKATTTTPKNVYQMVTDRIIAQMEQGIIPWHKPWHGILGKRSSEDCAVSYESGRPYSLLNQFLLGEPGEYATFNQIKARGGMIRKGEKSRMVVFYTQIMKEDTDRKDEDGNPKVVSIPVLKYYNVWNINQCEGLAARWEGSKQPEAPQTEPLEAAEAIVAGYMASANHPRLEVKISDRAFYRPATDEVVVPMLSQYDDAAEYYSTAFHELTHSTLKKSRCNREGDNARAFFGNHEYSREELVAEMGAAMLCSNAGIDSDRAFRNSVAYIQNWMQALKNDPKMIVWAASRAEKAARYIIGGPEAIKVSTL